MISLLFNLNFQNAELNFEKCNAWCKYEYQQIDPFREALFYVTSIHFC